MEKSIEPRCSSEVGNAGRDAAAALVLGGVVGAVALQAQTTNMTDADLLNYALRLEQLEAAFYNQALKQFTPADIAGADVNQNLGEVPAGQLYAYLSIIRDHENAHVRFLERTLRSFGVTPVRPCATYTFDLSSANSFLSTARTLENTGVAAYAGVLARIRSPRLREAALSIATVEARHAAYLNVISGNPAAPDAIDAGKTVQEILQAAAPFLGSCGA